MKTIENKFPSKLVALAALPLVALALTLVVGAFTQRAAATPPPGGGSTGSSTNIIAVGAFTPAPVDSSSPITHVAFAAQTIGKNSNVAGYVVEQTSIGTISGPVTCLTV